MPDGLGMIQSPTLRREGDGELIHRALERAGSQAELARALNVMPTTVWRWLHYPPRPIRPSLRRRLREYLAGQRDGSP